MKEELIKMARQTNLANYLISVCVPLVKNGNRYRHEEHESLVFTKNAYYWNSRSEHGNAIEYLMRHMNMEFKQAVYALTQSTINEDSPQLTATEFKERDLSINPSNSRVRKYLNESRHIGQSVINHLIKNKLLFQEKRTNNAIFPVYDEHNIMVGAHLQGTLTDKRFKGIKAGSKYGYGFNVKFSDNDIYDFALFFESAIDLISFIDYKLNYEKKNLQRCILISMSGLKENILQHTVKVFKGDLKIVLCVDNDEAGQIFKNKIELAKIPHMICCPDERFKDWNDQVTAWRGNKILSHIKNKEWSI